MILEKTLFSCFLWPGWVHLGKGSIVHETAYYVATPLKGGGYNQHTQKKNAQKVRIVLTGR